ncbi:hypothetical protein AVEN_130109-1 [Araneus ventricosus]|uniref:Uncharacterized protein n=1 Tax=Araneus ventricosus TaxID=182803 RepID=A0A4Y2ENQ9_ARAVE|nr:hypothetical protein AVEN_130109-1 [Araneus ventricosus]
MKRYLQVLYLWMKIKSLIQSDSVPNWDITFKTFSVHTQAVERYVKLVTEASGKACGAESRDSFIRTTLLSRSNMPNIGHKSDFKVPSAKNEWKRSCSIVQHDFLALTSLHTKTSFFQ